uniref:Sodium/hydrogen exchanger n=1 Tax=Trichobilharzia regenti TaxID=157069 RepID=A0AA85IRM9_TRIRE|nr:unnamed protein product [Trichobilharzia regenti]
MSSLQCISIIVYFFFVFYFFFVVEQHSVHAKSNQNTSHTDDIAIAKWKFHEFSMHITVMLFLFILILIKIAYHHIPYISEYVPESLLLIIIGITFGGIVIYEIEEKSASLDPSVWKFTPELFSYYLLPPIILESAYNLYNRTFSEYLGVVLLFSVLGTVFNFLIIGFSMYILFVAGLLGYPILHFDVKGFLLFSSLIVAVDPVAVLAIFQDIGVELSLYYIVFGESLFNDAITIVLYDIMVAFTGKEEITGHQVFIGILSFFTVSFGGLLIGVLFGVLTCLVTRIRSHLTVFTMLLLAYFSYIMADCVGWSGIISMIGCGLVQAAYAFHNIGEKHVKSVHLFTKMLSEVSEAVIFLFLGIQVVSYKLEWHSGFILWGLILCLLSRSIVIFSITAIVNYVNIDETKITLAQQIVLIYGGLRGAVAFALAVLISEKKFPINGEYHKNVIVTATLFIILFTVGFMGMTTKPLVRLLKIRKRDKQTLSLFTILNKSIIDQTLTGIETLTGSRGRNAVRGFFMRIDEKYIRRILQRNPERYDEKILKVYEHIALKLLYASMHPRDTENILKKIPEGLKLNHYAYDQQDQLQLHQQQQQHLEQQQFLHYQQLHHDTSSNAVDALTGVTQEWINRTNMYIVPPNDYYPQDYLCQHPSDNIPRDDSFLSAGQMANSLGGRGTHYPKISSFHLNDASLERLGEYSLARPRQQLDFNEAFTDLLQSRSENALNQGKHNLKVNAGDDDDDDHIGGTGVGDKDVKTHPKEGIHKKDNQSDENKVKTKMNSLQKAGTNVEQSSNQPEDIEMHTIHPGESADSRIKDLRKHGSKEGDKDI